MVRGSILAVLLAASVGPSAVAGEPVVAIEDGRVTLQAENTPFSALVEELGEAAGFDLQLSSGEDPPVSARFRSLPLDAVLERLLEGASWLAVREGAGGPSTRIRRLIVLDLAGLAARDVVVGAAGAPDTARPPPEPPAGRVLAGEGLEAVREAVWSEDDPTRRAGAALALGRVADPGAVPSLEGALADGSGFVRASAAIALAQIDTGQSSRALAALLSTRGDRAQRIRAAWALAKRDDPAARQAIAVAREDPDRLVRQAASAAAEGRTGGKQPAAAQ